MAKSKLSRGFKSFRNEVKDTQYKLKNIRDCRSCTYFYEDTNGDDEYCHNNSVTSYDLVSYENKNYCSFWQPIWIKERL